MSSRTISVSRPAIAAQPPQPSATPSTKEATFATTAPLIAFARLNLSVPSAMPALMAPAARTVPLGQSRSASFAFPAVSVWSRPPPTPTNFSRFVRSALARTPAPHAAFTDSAAPRTMAVKATTAAAVIGLPRPVIAILIIALLFSCFCFYKCANLTSLEESTGGAFYDQSASEIQEVVDHEVEDGYFNMSINTSVPVFEDNSAALGIKNIESNSHDCIVTVTLDDGAEVYKSGGLASGIELAMVTLT